MVEKASTDPEQRIYTNFKLHGTNSGRLSSANPNLQNITREYEDLPSIRALFKPSPGRVFVEADYSQAELRVIAYLSSDPELTRIYNEGLDLHNIAAERFYGPNYTKAQRSRAKNMNFGVAYRQTAQTFQEKHGIPESEGSKFIKWWWATFTGVAEWEKDIEQIINTSGILDTPFGRKRRFYLITKENQQASYREGIDFYPQSIASDFTLTSAIILAGELDPAKAKLVLTVHDSLLDDVVEDYADEAATITKQVMENQPRNSLGWTLPFEVKMSFGPSWGECK
jgi:DNA polymerase-1